ncbi:MAG: hypothetical protein ACRD28_08320 [Acidobacteriaceae bacterium]
MAKDAVKEIHDLNKDTPAKHDPGSATGDAEQAHRRVERAADKMAERASDRESKDDENEFSNIAPV